VLLFGSFSWLNAIHFPDFQEMSVAAQNFYGGNLVARIRTVHREIL